MQLHLQPTGKPESVRVRVGLFLTDEPPTRVAVGLRLGSETIDIAAGDAAYRIQDSFQLPVDVSVVAIQPHAHNLARRMEAHATLPDGSVVPLIAIDDWDFRWQDVYHYARPLTLPRGSTIAMAYEYDNSARNPRNPHRPPTRIVWGQNTTDEMGDLWLQIIPRNPVDADALNRAVRRKAHAEDLAAYTRLLERDPDNPLRHDAVAALYVEDGRVDDAIRHYLRSLQLNPASASTHYNAGIALAARSRREEAAAHFEQAIRIDSDYAAAHNNLGAIHYLMGKNREALVHYERAAALRPDNVEAQTNLAALLSAGGRAAEALVHYRNALGLRPDHPPALAGLAWIRATASDPALRDEREAVTSAERAAAQAANDLSVMDALAAAYASAGRYGDAVAVASRAADRAAAAGLAEVAARFRERLALYQQQRPYRVPSPR
jgi:tetratricopeptide (TPR) repeat protein